MTLTKLTACVVLATTALTGCQNIKQVWGKRNNGSLDYQSAQKLPPIKLPANQVTADFTPLYPTPTVGENTLNLTNESGKQYKLPQPPQVFKR